MTNKLTDIQLDEADTPMTRSELKRAQMLESAITLFCGQGFSTTSMDEVAKHAGVSKQTVYSHFGSKDELFVAAIEARCVVHQITDDLLTDSTQPEKVIVEFSRHFGKLIVSEESMTVFKTCVAQAETHPEVSKLFFEAGPKHILGLIKDYLSKVNQHGVYQFDNPHESAVRLCLMLFGELKMRLELGLDVGDLMARREDYIIDTAKLFLRAHQVNG